MFTHFDILCLSVKEFEKPGVRNIEFDNNYLVSRFSSDHADENYSCEFLVITGYAAMMALRLMKVTGKYLAWSLIAAALLLMVVRRLIPLYDLLPGTSC